MTSRVYRFFGLTAALAAAIALGACAQRQSTGPVPEPSDSVRSSPSADRPSEPPMQPERENDKLATTFVQRA
ncbi:hypothetical protein GE107_13230 [Cohnella sp. CFH 77786]|uniref:hypothetical protein n=1 Tax=Cohnella sp. CFH 77786 TaxID=2662265 RepID=UPI001C6091FF|nr:hypothetical protein [Cohnella sp. CFH 77786]MBW5447025.1 hypothetical protein [Cohnella sp. CFH 77786]